jgi:hypothetical protein
VLRLRESRDKFSGVTKREQLAAILQDDRIGEGAGQAFWHGTTANGAGRRTQHQVEI